jgi:HSP20 family molecular chaperone IbpA
MKIVSKLLVVSSLSMGLMTSARAIESNEPAYFSSLSDFMADFERCWQEDMREFHSSFVGTKKDVPAKPEGIDYAKFTIKELGKSDKAVYGIRITLPGVDPRSIKINLRNDNGNKKLSLTASLAATKPAATETAVDLCDDTLAKTGDAVDVKGATSAQPAKKDEAKTAIKERKVERVSSSQKMCIYKKANGRTRKMTVNDGQITVTMDLPAVDISDFNKSFKDGVIAIDFNKEASVEEQTISFTDEQCEKVAQPEK